MDFFTQLAASSTINKTTLLSGDDFTFLASLAVGGQGIISVVSNLYPDIYIKIYQDFMAGKLEHALTSYQKLLPVINALFIDSNPIPLKAALAYKGLCSNSLRLPLYPLTAQHHKQLIATLEAYQL